MESASDQRVENNVMRHEYRTLTEAEKATMKTIKDLGEEFAKVLVTCTPSGRERSLAITKIEEAVMWAVKGLTK